MLRHRFSLSLIADTLNDAFDNVRRFIREQCQLVIAAAVTVPACFLVLLCDHRLAGTYTSYVCKLGFALTASLLVLGLLLVLVPDYCVQPCRKCVMTVCSVLVSVILTGLLVMQTVIIGTPNSSGEAGLVVTLVMCSVSWPVTASGLYFHYHH